ncbi:hypothetical protein BTR23_03725 [Alkalihalophilus pseudofirmus]|nr:hypothetical protein BTR23_03725 [Alkalihalophilus pseudofirmus]
MEERNDYIIKRLTKKEVAGIRGFNLCTYLVALEGWRRGLSLKWYFDTPSVTNMRIIGFNSVGKTFSLANEGKIHFFNRSRGDKVANEAVSICGNKEQTKTFLSKANIPVPEGSKFSADTSDEEMITYAKRIGFPVVLKPTNGSLGKGVFTNIVDEDGLMEAITSLREVIKYEEYIIEKFIYGNEYRVYVVEDRVISAVHRIPANIVGDGKNTIKSLIENKNKDRKNNPYLYSKLIKMDDEMVKFLSKRGYTIETIPKKGEKIDLRDKSNISMGGDPIDATDTMSSEVKQIAIDTIKAIPELHHAGIDIIVNPDDPDQGTVIEVNATAGIGLHLFPISGETRDVPGAIIDFYFPETKNIPFKKSNLYFDYKVISDLLRSRSVHEVAVTSLPKATFVAKKYIISGKVQGVGYRNWIRRKAVELNINGYTKNLDNGKVVVVAASVDQNTLETLKELCSTGPERAKVTKVNEYEWEYPLLVGFEIRRKLKTEEIAELKSELKAEKQEVGKLKKELENTQKKYTDMKKLYTKMKNSRSWKVTSPIRKLTFLIKGKK